MDQENQPDQHQAYYAALYEQWQFLDFRGIMHLRMNQAINIPLDEIFVFPDLLEGSSPAPYAEFPYQSEQDSGQPEHSLSDDTLPTHTLIKSRPRLDLLDVLAKQKHLIILGDPGAGKTTLLRYIILKMRDNESALQRLPNISSFVPLYIPLTAYAAAFRAQNAQKFTFDDFLPLYLKYTYLDQYTAFLQQHLLNGQTVLLLDGLDEVDKEIQQLIIDELKQLASTQQGNYVLVTSRLAGYQTLATAFTQDTILANAYQEYTLAYFSSSQIERFVRQWYTAYERYYQSGQEHEQQEETLLQAIQLDEGVQSLATTPLFLTILTLIQMQGAVLPSHRVELFNLSVNTLINSWLMLKGYAESPRLNSKHLNDLLSHLAFEMYLEEKQHSLSSNSLLQKVEHYLTENPVVARLFNNQVDPPRILNIISGQTGLLLDRRKNDHYEFLHRSFGEYLAAYQLMMHKDYKALIKQHMHQPRWREVILLALGVQGILHYDKASVTSLVQDTILRANSSHERWLHRDLLFAGRCLADDVGMTEYAKRNVLSQFFELYFTTPYISLRKFCLETLSVWRGSDIAREAETLLVSLLKKLMHTPDIAELADALNTQPAFVQKTLTYYLQLDQENQHATVSLLRLQATTVLQALDSTREDDLDYAFPLLTDPSPLIRQIAATSVARLHFENPAMLSSLYALLSDPHPEVRRAGVLALNTLNDQTAATQDILGFALSDPFPEVRRRAAEALGNHRVLSLSVTDNLLQALYDPFTFVQQTAAIALSNQGGHRSLIVRELFALIERKDVATSVHEAALNALAYLDPGEQEEIQIILAVLNDEKARSRVRQAAATALCTQAAGQETLVIEPLMALLIQPSLKFMVRREIALTLGYLGTAQPSVNERLLALLSSTDVHLDIRCAAVVALSRTQAAAPHIIDAICSVLIDSDTPLKQEAINALRQLKVYTDRVWFALHTCLNHSDCFVREAAITALGILRENKGALTDTWSTQERLIDMALQDKDKRFRQAAIIALGKLREENKGAHNDTSNTQKRLVDMALLDRDKRVRQAAIAALGKFDPTYKDLLPYLSDILAVEPDAGIRAQVATILGELGAKRGETVNQLRDCLKNDNDPFVREQVVKALGQVQVHQEMVFHDLLKILADLHATPLLRTEAIEALIQLCKSYAPASQQLRQLVADTTGRTHIIEDILPQQTSNAYTETLVKHALQRNIEILSQVGGNQPDTIDLLMTILRSNDREIYHDSELKKTAIRAFHELDRNDPELCETLLNFLSTQGVPEDVQKEAIVTLGRMGKMHQGARDTMINTLSGINTIDKRSLIQALGISGSTDPEEIIQALMTFLLHPNPNPTDPGVIASTSDWEAALTVLGKIAHGSKKVIAMLIDLLKPASTVDLSIRLLAARILGQIGSMGEEVTKTLLSVLGYPDQSTMDPSSDVQKEAVQALVKLGYRQPSTLLTIYRSMRSDKLVRPAILTALTRLQNSSQEVATALVEALSAGSQEPLKIDVANALKGEQHLNPRVVQALCDNLEDHIDPTVRKKILTTLSFPGKQDSAVCRKILQALADDTPAVRKEAATTLGKIIETTEPLSERAHIHRALGKALTDSDSLVRREAAFALLSDNQEQTPDLLLVQNTMFSFLFAATAPVRRKAVQALGQSKNKRPHMVRALLRALSDEDHLVRKEAVSALSKIQTPALYIDELLVQHLQRYEPIVNKQISIFDEDTVDMTWLALQRVVEAHEEI